LLALASLLVRLRVLPGVLVRRTSVLLLLASNFKGLRRRQGGGANCKQGTD